MRYVITDYNDKERSRLSALAGVVDPYTFYQLGRVGVSPHWQCLEIGAGLGTVSKWLAEQISDEGHVLCTDLQTAFIDEIDHPRITVQQLDILAPPAYPERFDLVVLRALYHHVPDRELMLRNLVQMVRPGGHILMIEPDIHPMIADVHPVWSRSWRGFYEWGGRRGIDLYAGQRAPNQFADFGLDVVWAEGETKLMNGRSGHNPARDLCRQSMEVLSAEMLQKGYISQADIDELYALFENEAVWTMGFCFVAVHAVKPLKAGS